MPGVSVTVYAGTVFTLPNGQQPDPFPFTGVQVPVDRLPDAPVDGPGTLRAFIVAFQPDNTAANQPIAVSFPNFINTPPGVNMELDTLDPVVGDLVKYGTGTVSGDGTQVVPDQDPAHPGHRYGIQHFDWHGPMSPAPNGSNPGPNDDCTEGEDCEPSPDDGEPVDLSSGIQVIRQLDMRLGSERGEATVIRTYRTLSGNPGPFGVGSSHNYGYQLNTFNFIQGQGSITLIMPNGNQFLFVRQQNGTLINTNIPALKGAVMTSPSSGVYALQWKNGTVYNFAAPSAGPRTAFLNSIADANGNRVTLVRGNSASPIQISQIVDPAGRALNLSYDNFDRITSIIDPAGRTVSYTYNSQGTLSTVTDPAGGITRYTYNADGRLFQIIDPRNVTIVQNSYDSAGHITQQVLADGGIVQFSYTLLNPNTQNSPILQTQVTDPLGNVTTYHFDPLGFLLDVTDPSGAQRIFTRDPQSNMPLAITGSGTCAVCEAPERGDQTFTYDENGNVLVRTDGSGAATAFTYDPVFNKITSITNPLHNTTRFSYDASGNLLTITDANGKTTAFTYNSFGLLTSITDPLLQKVTYDYDSFGNLTAVTDPLGNKTQTSYDAISRPTQVVDASGRVTSVSYDPLNRVSNHVDAVGHSTRFTYDPNGNVLDVQDANGGHFKYSYDAAGRPLTLTFPNGKTETRTYDLNGNLVSFVDRRGQTSRYLYDPMNRLVQENYQDGSKITRSYDASGRLVHVVDSASGQFNMAYDEVGRLIRSSNPVGSVQYTYDASGQVASRTVAGQPAIQYSYDPAGDLLSATGQNSSVHLTYDAKRRLASMSRSNGVSSSYVHDPLGRLLTAKHGSANLQQYTYDATGNRSTYSSDIAQPLVTPAADYQYDVNNQLVSSNANTYTYDDAGNPTSVSGPNGATTYTWDARNRMVAIATPDGQRTSLVYDFKGNLISQTQTGPNINTSESFVLDMLSNVAFINKSDGDQMLVLSGAEIDQHFAVEHSNGTVEYGLNDSLNSTTATVDGNGVITARFNYEPYGATTTQSAYPFQYTGRMPVANGLYYYRARYYDTATGRFLSEDPAGLNEGVNFYRYVYDNPVNFIDPTGMTCTYSQSTGQMVCVDDSTGNTYYTGQGYAGTNSGGNNGRNNPNAQGQNDVGPLPRGDYQLTGDWHNSPNTGRNTMNLSPLPGNDCFQTGRDCNSFRIHGNNSRNDASHGCIVLPPDRTRIHPGETLHVVQ
ncbi:MAG TPA: RHS repeat-associated core domain-containing protein [Candidatus Angelobacter sp.]|nr:RHS repeat-associated core domain-containing protein [Candidatus Angelobacter sp.]